MRAIAALSVFLGHTVTGLFTFDQHPHLFLIAVQVADQGVAVFFLISGFLLYRPFVAARAGGPKLALGGFFRRRLLRIVPAYWAALSLALIAGVLSGVSTHNFWIFYLFGQVYSAATIGHGIGAAWTLCIEMTFYAVLPLLSLIAARLRGAVGPELVMLAALALASLAFRTRFHSFSDFATVSTLPGTFSWFALGMALAVLSVAWQVRVPAPVAVSVIGRYPTACWAGGAVAFVLLHELTLHVHGTWAGLAEHVLYAVVAMCLLLPAVFADERAGLARQLLRGRLLSWIGLISYAFYLYHTIVIQELARAFGPGWLRYPAVLSSSLLISCALAATSYYLLERPLMRYRRRAARRSGRPGHPPSAQEVAAR